MPNHKWTEKEEEFLKKNYIQLTKKQLADKLGLTKSQVGNRLARLGLKLPDDIRNQRVKSSQFPKGNKPWNTGLPVRNSPKSEFKKGNIPPQTKYNGAISLRFHKGTPYYFIRISKSNWIELHRYLWMKHYGEIPKGHIVVFKDGNQLNCRIENLELISKAENLKRNSKSRNELSENYILTRLKIPKDQRRDFLENFPDIIELKKEQLKLRRTINEVKR